MILASKKLPAFSDHRALLIFAFLELLKFLTMTTSASNKRSFSCSVGEKWRSHSAAEWRLFARWTLPGLCIARVLCLLSRSSCQNSLWRAAWPHPMPHWPSTRAIVHRICLFGRNSTMELQRASDSQKPATSEVAKSLAHGLSTTVQEPIPVTPLRLLATTPIASRRAKTTPMQGCSLRSASTDICRPYR